MLGRHWAETAQTGWRLWAVSAHHDATDHARVPTARVAALAGAWRAGRLRTVDALAVGRTPLANRGRWMARLTARLPLPRPASLGLARPFARPVQAMAVVAAVAFGAAALTFTVGQDSSLSAVEAATTHSGPDVTIGVAGSQSAPGTQRIDRRPSEPVAPAAVTEAIRSQPGTQAYYGTSTIEVTVSGVSGATSVVAFSGDAAWGGYEMISGRWIGEPGEAVVADETVAGSHGRLLSTTVSVCKIAFLSINRMLVS